MRPTVIGVLLFLIGALGSWNATLRAADDLQDRYEKTVDKAKKYFLTMGRDENGAYSKDLGPGVTALAAAALLRNGVSPDEPRLAQTLEYLLGFVREDGAICGPDSNHRNYETCLAVLCFTEANQDKRYDEVLKRADAYLRGLQYDQGEEKDRSDPYYGGAGYSSGTRPDLSNTSFLIEALKAVDDDSDSEAMQRAIVFVSRCQNLESPYNTTEFPAKNPDGGFYYTIAAGGQSQAGETANCGLRSYGSMTYAGLKSMLYAGLGPDDQRVKAATAWIRKHYDLGSNPGMGTAGLYYYYQTFAKALNAVGDDSLTDEAGVQHDWRADLIRELAERQQADGSWVNENRRWLEGDANLVTGYALLALSYCKPE
ncbi:MAG: prenyltransferase/squalene oxidase repeat-containing protein [Planctomycetota bacterium]